MAPNRSIHYDHLFQSMRPLNPRQQPSSSSRNPPTKTSTNIRPLAQEEIQYFEALSRILNSPDLLTLRSIHRNESRPQCRKHVQDEIDEFMANVSTSGKDTVLTLGTVFATTSENLVELCARAGASVGASAKKITLTELVRRAQESSSRKVRKGSVNQEQGRGPRRTSLAASPRADADEMDLDGVVGGLDHAAGTPRSIKSKGKQRIRRRDWEEDEDRDILDALDR